MIFRISIIYFTPIGSSGSVSISSMEVFNIYFLFTNGVGQLIDGGITIGGYKGVEILFCIGVDV